MTLWAAFRNYFTPVFLRENALIVAASLIVALLALNGFLMRDDTLAVLANSRHAVFLVWGACWIVPGTVYAHYWRQISTPLAPSIPRMIGTEYRAALVMTLLAVFLIDAPFVLSGARWSGMLTLTLGGIVLSGSFMPPVASARGMPSSAWLWITRVRLGLLAGLAIVGYQRRWLFHILEIPSALAVPLAVVCAVVLIALLWFVPTLMRRVIGRWERHQDARTSFGGGRFGGLAAILDWHPKFWPHAPVPAQFALPAGPIGMAIATIWQYGIIFAIDLTIYHFSGDARAVGLREITTQAMALTCGLTAAQMSQSLLNRSGFVLTYIAGLYGSRRQYSRSVFRHFVLNGTARGVFIVAVGLAVPLWLQMVTPVVAVADAVSIIVIILGSSLLGALPLLWYEFGGIGIAAFCAMFGYTFCYGGVFAALTAEHSLSWEIPATTATVAGLCGFVIYRIAPARLSEMDWPIEFE